WTLEEPKGELGLGDPPDTALGEGAEHRSVRGDSRTDHHDLGAGDPGHVVFAELDVGSQGSELVTSGSSPGICARIRDIDCGSLLKGEAGGRGATRAEAHDRH